MAMSDPYATWDGVPATDMSDGFPDVLMVPLVEDLRAAGFVTFQSCQGHLLPEYGHVSRDGGLWIRQAPPCPYSMQPFTRIQHVMHGPEGPLIEFWWHPSDQREAILELRRGYGVED